MSRALPGWLLLWLVPLGLAAEVDQDAILGHWQPDPRRPAVITVRRVEGRLEGVISHNPRTPEKVGDVILRDLVFDPDAGHWTGEIYAPTRGRRFDIVATVPEGDALVLQISTLFGTFERVWQRVVVKEHEKSAAPPPTESGDTGN